MKDYRAAPLPETVAVAMSTCPFCFTFRVRLDAALRTK